jgi:hypothetical protein
MSAGFVEVYPNRGYGPGCEEFAPLAHGSATIAGTCLQALAPEVRAVYSVTFNPAPGTVMARASLPWS